MVRKISLGLILAAAVLYLPWWLALAVFGSSAILLRHPYGLLGTALFFDWFYGLPPPDSWPLATGIVVVLIPLAIWGRSLIRWG